MLNVHLIGRPKTATTPDMITHLIYHQTPVVQASGGSLRGFVSDDRGLLYQVAKMRLRR